MKYLTLIKEKIKKMGDKWCHEYKCICGNTIICIGSYVKKSCGCMNIKNNRLILIKKNVGRTKGGAILNKYKCKCGNIVILRGICVGKGHTKSCGCLSRETASKNNSTHRLTDTRLYTIWASIKTRCFNKNWGRYKDWGGRGITMCKEWKNDFKLFYDWAMKNGYKKNLCIDRRNNNGNYTPGNCRWVTYKINNMNTRRRKVKL